MEETSSGSFGFCLFTIENRTVWTFGVGAPLASDSKGILYSVLQKRGEYQTFKIDSGFAENYRLGISAIQIPHSSNSDIDNITLAIGLMGPRFIHIKILIPLQNLKDRLKLIHPAQ
eukprot:TRINITY_DN1874_c3_g1_i1.p2 TRINITY_DN1874_c3_g1~~TRINITY_DN1874_c3_g1_i1.p2  ORF type:complete len:124 (+),score=25.90 TRINITY_DN1874_c3_g1_i1:26-373(+)